VARATFGFVRAIQEQVVSPDVTLCLAPLKPDQHACSLWGHRGPEVWIDWIEATQAGDGRAVMARLCRVADDSNVLLRGSVDGHREGALYRYYRSFGFVRDPAGSEIMERAPLTSRAQF
jgi:hypothetical protein